MAPPAGSMKSGGVPRGFRANGGARSYRLAQRCAQDGHTQHGHFTQHFSGNVRLRSGAAFAAARRICNGCVCAHAAWRGGGAAQADVRRAGAAGCALDAAVRRGGRRARRARSGGSDGAERARRKRKPRHRRRPAGCVHHRARADAFLTHTSACVALTSAAALAWTWQQRAGACA
jgi:hypothetical protein